ncbi:MAG: DNA mismatch repair endonuclease MutL [Desulfitobacteriaceae bacterium]
MNSSIRILDQHSANQIAAGEVVERPVSVVKELIENALDARAKRIDISIEQNGLPLIRVRDDGYGIAAEDLPTAILRHATSKISSINDLNQLLTLGFRGEALPSIASVSHLEITSRPHDRISGSCLTVQGGQQLDIQEIGCTTGTTVVIRDLFFNTPARKKFLKSVNTEFGLISDIVGRLALARPEVAFTLTHPHQVLLQTTGLGQWLNTIGAILGNDLARRLIPVSATSGNWFLEGYISPPDLVRSSKQGVTFIINGRYIRSSFLSRALVDGYHTLIPAKLYPIAILHLHLLPSDYDVNVHPTKMDIRFNNEQGLTKFIQEEIRQTLLKSRSVPGLGKNTNLTTNQNQVLKPNSSPASLNQKANLVVSSLGVRSPNELITSQQINSILNPEKYTSASPNYTQDLNHIQETPDHSKTEDYVAITNTKEQDQNSLFPGKSITLGPLREFWPLAQLFNTYILTTDGQVLMIIDQHAAHERINYERLLKKAQQNHTASQQLLIPIPLELTLQEEQALLEHLWTLTELGFIIEHFGPKTYLLRGIPAYTGSFSGEELLREFIEQVLLKNHTPGIEQLLEEWIYLLACHESIKAHDNLSLLEMEQLIAQLSQTENPYTCPHGRPTMIQMTAAELGKRFYRG